MTERPLASRTQVPFRPFFLLGSVDAVGGTGVFLLAALEAGGVTTSDAVAWHRYALLFGTIPAMLSGFLLTALPRWTGRPAVSSRALGLLLALWIASRAASLVSTPAGLGLAALFLGAVAMIAARDMLACGDRRNRKIVLLLLGLGLASALTAADWHGDTALRMALASIVGLLAVIGGRVVPALSAAWLDGAGSPVRRPVVLERFAATVLLVSLAAWIAAPHSVATGIFCAASCAGQLARLLSWRGWRTSGNWSIFVLHVGYSWIAVGFALLALHVLRPDLASEAAAVHAWMVGAFGTLGMAIMSSMIRKHAGRPFSRVLPASAAYAAITLSALARLTAETPLGDAGAWAAMSSLLWVASFALFLSAFGRDLASLRPVAQ